jgi:hypothetical protein
MILNRTVARIAALLFVISSAALQAQQAAPKSRSFYMGFTPFVSDITEEARTDMANFFKGNSDIIAQHMESVPWTEALSGEPFKQNLMDSWKGRQSLTPPGGKVYVALSPGRNNLADYWGAGEHDPLPAEFKGKTFNDPIVERAYLNYCKRAIEFFHPDFLAISIEFNELMLDAPAKVAAYSELHEYVYKELKKQYPQLPIFGSFTLHSLLDSRRPKADRDRALASIKALMPYNDVIAISFYPFFGNLSDQVDSSFTFLTSQFDEFKKPYAVAETGEAADEITVQLDGKPWAIHGSPAKQLEYYQKLFALAQSKHMKFLIAFLYKDYDELWKKIAASAPAVFQAWQDNGLLDEKGVRRPSYQLWKQFFDAPVSQ